MSINGECVVNRRGNDQKELLHERAVELAKTSSKAAGVQQFEAFLEVSIMGLRYAVILNNVDVVGKVDEVFVVPMTPPHITGVIRRRGQPIALISLRHFFYPHTRGIADADYAVVVVAQGKRFALQVEEIEGVRQLDKSALVPPSDTLTSEQIPYISAVTTDGLAVIDLDRLVQAEVFVIA